MSENLDIESILSELGYNLEDRGDYWQSNAVYRGGDNKTALQIYKDTGVWKDYVQETGFLPFKALVEKSCEDLDKDAAQKILKGIDLDPSIKSKGDKPKKITFDEIYPDSILEKLLPHYEFYNKRNISTSLLKKVKGGLSTQGQMYQRFVFPIYNQHMQIFGFAGRDMSNKEGRPKWKHVGKKTKWCYPFHHPNFFNQSDWSNQDIILVESIGDFLSISENTDLKCLVTFGLDISPSLINSLISISPKKIFISFNNDTSSSENRGLNASIKSILKLLQFFDKEKLKICLPIKNDFGDMDKNDYNQWQTKLNNISKKHQYEDIKRISKDLFDSKRISKNLYSKLKLINE